MERSVQARDVDERYRKSQLEGDSDEEKPIREEPYREDGAAFGPHRLAGAYLTPVSYTHLTLPTILLV